MSGGVLRGLLENPANRPTLVLGVALTFLLLLWLIEITASPEPIVLPPPTAPSGDVLPDTRFAVAVETPSLAEYESVIERPLFNEDRLPSDDEDADAEEDLTAGNTQAPPMQLAGVVLTGDHQIAMLTREGQPLRVEVGMDVDGWVLENLEPRRAILSNGVNSVELELPIYAAPQQRDERKTARAGSSVRSKQSNSSRQGQTGQAMNVRDRIQRAREERERLRQEGGQNQGNSRGRGRGKGQDRRSGG